MRQYDVRHIDGDQFRFLKRLVEDGTVEATITIRRLKSFLPDRSHADRKTTPSKETG